MSIVELSQRYADLKKQLNDTEENYKNWRRDAEDQLYVLSQEILAHMRESEQKTLHTSSGMFGTTTKSLASISSMPTFINWLKTSPDNIDCAVVKPRQDAVKRLVEQNGEPPVGVTYERTIELTFRRT